MLQDEWQHRDAEQIKATMTADVQLTTDKKKIAWLGQQITIFSEVHKLHTCDKTQGLKDVFYGISGKGVVAIKSVAKIPRTQEELVKNLALCSLYHYEHGSQAPIPYTTHKLTEMQVCEAQLCVGGEWCSGRAIKCNKDDSYDVLFDLPDGPPEGIELDCGCRRGLRAREIRAVE